MCTTTSDFVNSRGARLVKLRLLRYGQAVPHKSLHFLVTGPIRSRRYTSLSTLAALPASEPEDET